MNDSSNKQMTAEELVGELVVASRIANPAYRNEAMKNHIEDYTSPLHTKIAAQDARIGELENALLTARESIELFERVLLPKAESWMLDHGQQNLHPDVQKVMPLKFGEWTHYANTLRMIKATLQGSEVEG